MGASMHKIQVQLKSFSAANRLSHHYSGVCKNIHGHNYDIAITIGAETLDEFGFVMDFTAVKDLCNNWIQDNWDHSVIVNADDVTWLEFLQKEKQKYFLLPENLTSSSENLAKYAFEEFSKIIAEHKQGAKLLQVEICETRNCKAIYSKS